MQGGQQAAVLAGTVNPSQWALAPYLATSPSFLPSLAPPPTGKLFLALLCFAFLLSPDSNHSSLSISSNPPPLNPAISSSLIPLQI